MRTATLPMAHVPRAQTVSETRGRKQAVADARGDRVPGCTMFCTEAGAVMAVVRTARLAGMP